MAKARRTRGAALRAVGVVTALLGLALVPLMSATEASADPPWGATGSSYRSGIVCALPDGRRVALASWAVDGVTAFSVADVVARGASYGRAPRSGNAAELAPGTRGLSAADLAGLAYLIGHPGAGTPVQVAETSALVARAFGGGVAQQACLGQQGTSATAAAALAYAERRFAGPYTVQVSPTGAKPGSSAPVSATVLSATGVPTPGIAVSFSVDGASTTGVTGTDGQADARITAPSTAAAVLTATVTEPTRVRLIDSRPASVALAAATPVVARAAFVPVLHPTPRLSVAGGGAALVLAGGSLTPTAAVTGTYGYSGTGAVSVIGPVAPPGGGTCSDAAYTGAPAVWNGTFAFTGDGSRPAGSTGALQPGCYAFTGSVTTTDAVPAVTVTTAADPATAVGVSALHLTQSVGSGLAGTGVLTATVTATAAAGATVTSTLTTYGPLAATSGAQCDVGQNWTAARVLARSATVTLAQSGVSLSGALRTPAVAATGCYALVARSTVAQDGRSVVVAAAPGASSTVVRVIAPSVGVTNSTYDGRQGVPMTGTVQVTGTDGLAGHVTIGLVSAPAPATGCHDLTFPTTTTMPAGSTTVDTDGDGHYGFRSPVPSQNRCYGVVAMLAMSTDTEVRAGATSPGVTAVFLAGAVVRAPVAFEEHTGPTARPTRELAVLGVAAAVVVVVALVLMIGAAVGGEHKPDPRAGELLLELTDRAGDPAV